MDYQTNYQIQLATIVDVSKTNLSTTAAKIMDIPQGFVCTGVLFEELAKCGTSLGIVLVDKAGNAIASVATGASDPSFAYVLPSGGTVSGTTTVSGAETATGADAVTASTSVPVPGAWCTKDGDELGIKLAEGTADAGRLRIGLVGFLSGMTAKITVASETGNVAVADPYRQPEDRH